MTHDRIHLSILYKFCRPQEAIPLWVEASLRWLTANMGCRMTKQRQDSYVCCAGDSPKGSPLEDTFTKASPRMSPSVSRTASAGDEGGSIAGARTTSQDEGGDHGKKEHGSLFASARAFFKRKEADGKH